MIVFIHIAIAIISLVQVSLLVISPSHGGLYRSYGLISMTLLSGTALVFSAQRPLLQTCLTGLAYAAVAIGATVFARARLATRDSH
jgi:hypothetical protein